MSEPINRMAHFILDITNKHHVRANSVNLTHRYLTHQPVVGKHRETKRERRTDAKRQRGNIDRVQTMLSSEVVYGAKERSRCGTHRYTARSFDEFDGRARRSKSKEELAGSDAADEIHWKDVHPTAMLNTHEVDRAGHHVVRVEASEIGRRHTQAISPSCCPGGVPPR